MKEKTDSKKDGVMSFRLYLKQNIAKFLLVLGTMLIIGALAFVRTATSSTISSFRLEDYEIGQISDVTIKANKSLSADFKNPVSVERGEKVIRKGFPITEEGYAKLKKMSESPAYIDFREFANSLIVIILMAAFAYFLFTPVCIGRRVEFKEIALMCVFIVLVYGLTILGCKTAIFSDPYTLCIILPCSFCAVILAILFGQLDAVFFSFLMAAAVFSASHFMVIPTLYVLATSLSGTRIVFRIERRIDLVIASFLQLLLNIIFVVILKIIFLDSFRSSLLPVLGCAFNGFISGILVLGFLTPLELLLNTASVFRLMDLSDLNSPTMKRMLLIAGGTYSHSMMVASLAESACREIGANALVARVGAYYHDIGKMDAPEYFVENQSGENKHDTMNPSLSVSVIRSHVKKGVEKAHSLRLPKQVVDIIAEHHGDSVIQFFYSEALKQDPDANQEDYSYSGNPPTTKESAVVMLADTVEAACRTLEKPSVPRLEKFIQMLIDSKIQHHQLDNAPLTFGDLKIIKDKFVQILASYYHSRIEYPDQKDPEKNPLSQEGKTDVAHENVQNPAEKKAEVKGEKKLIGDRTIEKAEKVLDNVAVSKEKKEEKENIKKSGRKKKAEN